MHFAITDKLRSKSTNRAIVSSMSMSFITKMFTFAQSLVVSYAFGTSKSTDILFFALSLVILLSSFLQSINQQVIVPNAISIRSSISEEDSQKFISYVYMLYLFAGIVITAILYMFPVRIFSLFSRFAADDIRSHVAIIRYIIPVFLLIIINSYILDVFTSYKYFTLPMFLDMVKNLLIIVFVLVFKNIYAVESLAMGVLAGNLAQILILNLLLITVLRFKPAFKRYRIDKTIRRNMVYVVVGQFATFLTGYITMYLMSGFNAGIYSAMDYSQKINTVFSSVVVGQISTVIGINIIELNAKGDYSKLNDIFQKYLKTSLFLIFPFCFIISLNSEIFISIVFERGKFDRNSAMVAGEFLKYFIFNIPYALINSFIVRLIIAKQIQRIAFLCQISQSAGTVLVIWAMVKGMGYIGYPIGLIITTTAYIILLMHFLLKSQFGYIDSKAVIKYFLFSGILNAVIMGCLYFIMRQVSAGAPGFGGIGIFTVSSVVYLVLYVLLGYYTGLNRDAIAGIITCVKSVLKQNKGESFLFARKQYGIRRR